MDTYGFMLHTIQIMSNENLDYSETILDNFTEMSKIPLLITTTSISNDWRTFDQF